MSTLSAAVNYACQMFLLKLREGLFFLCKVSHLFMLILHHKEPVFVLSLEASAAKLTPACLEEGWSIGKDGQGKAYLCLRHMIGNGMGEEETWLWS